MAALISQLIARRTGILAIFAAKAGARQVYAVEATSMAKHAAALVKANGVRGFSQHLCCHVHLVAPPSCKESLRESGLNLQAR